MRRVSRAMCDVRVRRRWEMAVGALGSLLARVKIAPRVVWETPRC